MKRGRSKIILMTESDKIVGFASIPSTPTVEKSCCPTILRRINRHIKKAKTRSHPEQL